MSKQPETIVPFEASRRYIDIKRDSRYINNAFIEATEARSMYFSEALQLLTDKLGKQHAWTEQYKDRTDGGYNVSLDRNTFWTLDRFLPMLKQLTPQTIYEVRGHFERYDQLLLSDPDPTKSEAGRKITRYILGFLTDLERF